MKHIGLLGFIHYDNLGDHVIRKTCRCLVDDIIKKYNCKDIEISEIDILPKFNYRKNLIRTGIIFLVKVLRKLTCKMLGMSDKSAMVDSLIYFEMNLKYRRYFMEHLKEQDAIIFVGGAYLKYSGELFQYTIRMILSLAERMNIPVMFNAIGIEGYDDSDARCQNLKKPLNRSCVKYVTTRDDIELLNHKFITSNIKSAQVADVALWLTNYFNANILETEKVVGINVAYLDLFKVYNLGYGREKYISIYKEVVDILKRKNIKFKFFCNGKEEDYRGGLELVRMLGCDEEIMMPKATSPEELIQQISRFYCIIPIRLHACIIASAIGIPCVGYIWNNKVQLFADIIGNSGNFQRLKDFDAEKLVSTISNTSYALPNVDRICELKTYTRKYLEEFIVSEVMA